MYKFLAIIYEGKRQSRANALHAEFFYLTQFTKTAHQREYILAYPTPVMLCLEKLMIQAVKRTAAFWNILNAKSNPYCEVLTEDKEK